MIVKYSKYMRYIKIFELVILAQQEITSLLDCKTLNTGFLVIRLKFNTTAFISLNLQKPEAIYRLSSGFRQLTTSDADFNHY